MLADFYPIAKLDWVKDSSRAMHIQFDTSLANELERLDPAALEHVRAPVQRNALVGYERSLTERGGFQVTYRDQLANTFLDCVRCSVWIAATGAIGWWLFFKSPLSMIWCFAGVVLAGIAVGFVAFRKIPTWHSIEIHPDGMIVDGRFFSADLIGENWPLLQMRNDDPDRLMLCGVYNTRFVEYATANRYESNDRIPETLAQDLEIAMEQLWGRRDVMVVSPD